MKQLVQIQAFRYGIIPPPHCTILVLFKQVQPSASNGRWASSPSVKYFFIKRFMAAFCTGVVWLLNWRGLSGVATMGKYVYCVCCHYFITLLHFSESYRSHYFTDCLMMNSFKIVKHIEFCLYKFQTRIINNQYINY